MRRRVLLPAFVLMLLLSPQAGRAWGLVGHAAIADIAEWHLTPAALDQVHALLRDENHEHLDQVSSWADEIRKGSEETAPWHFVSIPLTESQYDAARECSKGDCVIDAIARFRAILSDRSQSDAVRLDALKFLVHFVGDVQQPLHATDNADRGGNNVIIRYFDQAPSRRPLNLHALWDSGIISHELHLAGANVVDQLSVAKSWAMQLDREIGKEEADVPQIVDPVAWALESHEWARTVAYSGVVVPGEPPPSPSNPPYLGGDYERRAWPVVQQRIMLGGLRLAAVLNQALAS